MTLTDALLVSNKFYANVIVGALIHKITEEQAETVAGLMQQHATLFVPFIPAELDRVAYLAAVMRQESGFDEKAMNFNLPLGPNPDLAGRALEWLISRLPGYPVERRIEFYLQTRPLENADMGIAMRKVKFARVEFPGIADRQIVEQHLFNPVYAVAWMARSYRGLFEHVTKHHPEDDPKWAATGCYKAGRRGYKERFNWASTQKHIQRVQEHFTWFRQNLTQEG